LFFLPVLDLKSNKLVRRVFKNKAKFFLGFCYVLKEKVNAIKTKGSFA
jgi:hypothetical protein